MAMAEMEEREGDDSSTILGATRGEERKREKGEREGGRERERCGWMNHHWKNE
jgi:hypothetical protein